MPLCSENVYFFKKCAPRERCCPAVQHTVELNQLPDWKVKKQNNYGEMVRQLQKNVLLLISLVMKKISSIKDGIC